MLSVLVVAVLVGAFALVAGVAAITVWRIWSATATSHVAEPRAER